MAKPNILGWTEDSLVADLTQLRAAFAKIYKGHAPEWRGASYATRREYPYIIDHVRSDGWSEGNNARTAVWACDWMLWLLQATQSKKGYTISERELTQLVRWYAVVDETVQSPQMQPFFTADFRERFVRAAMMRDAKAKLSPGIKMEKHERALEALEEAKHKYPIAAEDNNISFLKVKAAKQLGVHRSTFYRWLRGSE